MGSAIKKGRLASIYAYPYIRLHQLIQTKRQILPSPLTPSIVFKCLSDETRTRIMLLITREAELCVCELTGALDESQPKISRHLAQLRACGLLEDRRQGQWVYYRLHPELPDWVVTVLDTTLAANRQWLDRDARRLADMGDRPVRTSILCGESSR